MSRASRGTIRRSSPSAANRPSSMATSTSRLLKAETGSIVIVSIAIVVLLVSSGALLPIVAPPAARRPVGSDLQLDRNGAERGNGSRERLVHALAVPLDDACRRAHHGGMGRHVAVDHE